MSELTGRGQIERKELSLVPRSVSKVYDGSTGYTMTAEDLNHLSSQLEAADVVTQATMSFANSQVSRAADGSVLSNKAVQLDAVTIEDGNQGGNYQLVLQGNATSLISPKALMVSAIAAGQSTYGEAVLPGAVSLQGVLVGDQVNATASLLQVLTSSSGRIRAGVYQQGTNPDLLGKDAGNYSLTAFSTVTPNFEVTPRVIQSSAVVQDKVYDGNSQATLASLDSAGVLQGDALSMSSGEVRFNGQDLYKSQDTWRKKMGYVPQEDIIHQELSVQKAVTYAAKLRLPQELPDERRKALVTRVIHEVGLDERKNVTIRKLSGGQRKRVSVAVELLNRPEILFLDEPTSGQDPGLEIAMMQLFKGFTRQGATVIVTTHAMASIEELDIVVLLQAGYLVFMGPPQALLDVFGGRSYEGIYQTLAKQSPLDSLNQFRRSAYAGWPGGSR
jgi:energy-coupling factor transporter ATP-binding protein EcfA2